MEYDFLLNWNCLCTFNRNVCFNYVCVNFVLQRIFIITPLNQTEVSPIKVHRKKDLFQNLIPHLNWNLQVPWP